MRKTIGTLIFAGTLFCAPLFTSASPQHSSTPKGKTAAAARSNFGNADAITEDELKTYDYFLSADQLEGRNLPSRGYDVAALYVASHLKEWGLKPGGSTTGTDGPLQPYFLPMDLVSSQVDASKTSLTVTLPKSEHARRRYFGPPALEAGPHKFEYATKWTVGSGSGFRRGPALESADITGAALVFAGNGYVINKTHTNPYEGIDVRGKVIIVAGLPSELAAMRGAGRGRRGSNPLGEENVDYLTPQDYAAKNGALAVITIPNLQQVMTMADPEAALRGPGPNGPRYQVVKFQREHTPSVPTVTAGLELVSALFQDEKATAAQVLEDATTSAGLKSFELNQGKKLDLHIAVDTEHGHAEDVVGILEGGDPVLKNEYVVISAHLDHIGLSSNPVNGDNVNNGADDDASGCAGLLAMARAYAEGAARGMRPKRSIIFLFNGGEEKGLWGSQYFCEFPPVDISKVVVDLNMDMIGRRKTPGYKDPPSYKLVEENEVFVVGPNISSKDLADTLAKVNGSYLKMKVNDFYDVTQPDATHDNLGPSDRGQRIFYRSDHYNFAKMGIPIAFFCDGLHVDYHQVTDSPDKLDYHMMQSVSRTIAALAWTIGNNPERPKLDKDLPERLVSDMKAAKEQGWGKLTPVEAPLPGMPF